MKVLFGLGCAVGLASAIGVGAGASGCGSDANAEPPEDPNGGLGDFGPGTTSGNDSGACQGLKCQQVACASGTNTTVTGTVFAPNGTLPLYNAIVYVPNSEPAAFIQGARCDTCGAVTGNPVVSALSDATGKFALQNVPVGKDIPLVIQVGKWRRQVKIPIVEACKETKLTDTELTRLPKKQSEGDMPKIAFTTGECDNLGCMLPKIGIDASEFGVASDGPRKAVHTYTNKAPGPSGAKEAFSLWGNATTLKSYDVIIMSSDCGSLFSLNEGPPEQVAANNQAFRAIADYLNAGGRVFSTGIMSAWSRFSPDNGIRSIATWYGGLPTNDSITFDTTFPKGKALVDWLHLAGATPLKKATLKPDICFPAMKTFDRTKIQIWGSLSEPVTNPGIFTVNTPVGIPANQQCGKGIQINAQINDQRFAGSDVVDANYPKSCSKTLKPGENLLAFFFFDLASCIQDEAETPEPPVVR